MEAHVIVMEMSQLTFLKALVVASIDQDADFCFSSIRSHQMVAVECVDLSYARLYTHTRSRETMMHRTHTAGHK